MMVGRLLSFWGGISSGAMLHFRWVSLGFLILFFSVDFAAFTSCGFTLLWFRHFAGGALDYFLKGRWSLLRRRCQIRRLIGRTWCKPQVWSTKFPILNGVGEKSLEKLLLWKKTRGVFRGGIIVSTCKYCNSKWKMRVNRSMGFFESDMHCRTVLLLTSRF